MSYLRFDIWEKINVFEAILIGIILLEKHLLLPKYDSKCIAIESTGKKKLLPHCVEELDWHEIQLQK